MLEKELEQYIIGHLDLIEPGLKLKGNQIDCHGKRVDILCEDRYGILLIMHIVLSARPRRARRE